MGILRGDAGAARGRRLDQTIDEKFAAFDDRRVVLAAQPYLDVASAGLDGTTAGLLGQRLLAERHGGVERDEVVRGTFNGDPGDPLCLLPTGLT